MKSVFGFCVRLGNPDLDFENLNPDFLIERTLGVKERDHFKFGAGGSSYFCCIYLGLPGCRVHALGINQPKG